MEKALRKRLAVTATTAAAVCVLGLPVVGQAAAVSVTGLQNSDATVTDTTGKSVSGDFSGWENYQVNYHWSLATGTPVANGDTATVTLPNGLTADSTLNLPLKDQTGQTIGTFTIQEGATTGTITFNGQSTTDSTLAGTLAVYSRGTSKVMDTQNNWTINKIGWIANSAADGQPTLLTWNVAFNAASKPLGDVTITDDLGSNQTYVPGSVIATEGTYDSTGAFVGNGQQITPVVTKNGNQLTFLFQNVDTAVNMTYNATPTVTGTGQVWANTSAISGGATGNVSAQVAWGGTGSANETAATSSSTSDPQPTDPVTSSSSSTKDPATDPASSSSTTTKPADSATSSSATTSASSSAATAPVTKPTTGTSSADSTTTKPTTDPSTTTTKPTDPTSSASSSAASGQSTDPATSSSGSSTTSQSADPVTSASSSSATTQPADPVTSSSSSATSSQDPAASSSSTSQATDPTTDPTTPATASSADPATSSSSSAVTAPATDPASDPTDPVDPVETPATGQTTTDPTDPATDPVIKPKANAHTSGMPVTITPEPRLATSGSVTQRPTVSGTPILAHRAGTPTAATKSTHAVDSRPNTAATTVTPAAQRNGTAAKQAATVTPRVATPQPTSDRLPQTNEHQSSLGTLVGLAFMAGLGFWIWKRRF
ncbi:collagen binding domain-containing protein [Levilactobacillus namurensis]|uniref:Collagen binding domain-containing protein n=1 Tax=Levilactobacillus namurensis TaxID=380393 RepID=A0AAW8W128_9LACO|nr:collagen binding domain-containing protein [Levilactobacillus namurensis]MDT7013711.1 collagen binding domain-containing protein [Levilactobacillus namurensis]